MCILVCGPPAVPLNARAKTVSGGDLAGITEATYECDSGYELFGPAKVRCDARKGWERELPFCGKPRGKERAIFIPCYPCSIFVN